MTIELGTAGRAECTVSEKNTAIAAGSGSLPVFGTPFLAALIEQAAVRALTPQLAPEERSVGTHLNLSHDSATPTGLHAWAEATVAAIAGKQISFTVSAWDEAGPIGHGTHDRVVITAERFLAKAERKRMEVVPHVN